MLVCKSDNTMNASGSSDVKLRVPPKGIPSLSHSQIITNTLSARRHTGFSVSLLFEHMYTDRVLLFVIVDSDAHRCFIPTK